MAVIADSIAGPYREDARPGQMDIDQNAGTVVDDWAEMIADESDDDPLFGYDFDSHLSESESEPRARARLQPTPAPSRCWSSLSSSSCTCSWLDTPSAASAAGGPSFVRACSAMLEFASATAPPASRLALPRQPPTPRAVAPSPATQVAEGCLHDPLAPYPFPVDWLRSTRPRLDAPVETPIFKKLSAFSETAAEAPECSPQTTAPVARLAPPALVLPSTLSGSSNPQLYVDMRGKRSGADRKKKRTFGVEAYEHWEKVEGGMGRLCPSTCPKGGRCGDILTLNDYRRCHEYSFGAKTRGQREAITRDIIKEACSCEQSMSNAHDKWAELVLRCFTISTEGEVRVCYRICHVSDVCAEAMRTAYGINVSFWNTLVCHGR